MPRVHLVHWHADECRERASRLRALGYEVRTTSGSGDEAYRLMRADPPAAVVIDLDRLPSHGRQLALALQQHRTTRALPVVFVGGAPPKLDAVRASLPAATFTRWSDVAAALSSALRRPSSGRNARGAPPATSTPAAAGYSGTPLPKKLGIEADRRVIAVGAPPEFAAALGELPAGAELRTRLLGTADVVVLFARRLAELRERFARAQACLAERGSLWVAWPKKAARVPTDLTEDVVRPVGLTAGMVDTKVCAIDAIWSGLRFQRRRAR
jgi:CheY-like chemotaxis protein